MTLHVSNPLALPSNLDVSKVPFSFCCNADEYFIHVDNKCESRLFPSWKFIGIGSIADLEMLENIYSVVCRSLWIEIDLNPFWEFNCWNYFDMTEGWRFRAYCCSAGATASAAAVFNGWRGASLVTWWAARGQNAIWFSSGGKSCPLVNKRTLIQGHVPIVCGILITNWVSKVCGLGFWQPSVRWARRCAVSVKIVIQWS